MCKCAVTRGLVGPRGAEQISLCVVSVKIMPESAIKFFSYEASVRIPLSETSQSCSS